MPSEGNGAAWHIAFAGTVGQDIKTLYQHAKSLGLGTAFINALNFAFRRMQHDALAFGELVKQKPNSQFIIHVRVVKPLVIEFAIHEETHNVLIQRVQLLP